MKKKYFKVVKPGTDEDVLGGPISEDNPYISSYPSCDVSPLSLGLYEKTRAKFNLSGTKGVYEIVRVDAPE